ncbi:hypothetical protein WI604_16380 [Bradyrhizobium symbiodeficiens]|uniref:hypothetical protein n=1 Tax=Bradyrhizobium symbiodeficiens TaxID=1404367 RepID=UPI0030D4C8EF
MLNRKISDRLMLGWMVLRLPLLLLFALVFRQPIVEAALLILNQDRAVILAIDIFSTPLTRVLFAGLMTATLVLFAVATWRLPQSAAYFVVNSAGLIIMAAALKLTGRSPIYLLPGLILLGTNLIAIDTKEPPTRPEHALLSIGGAEIFLFWRYVRWLNWLWSGTHSFIAPRRWAWVVPGAAFASIMTAGLLGAGPLVRIEQSLRWPEGVRQIASGDYNWITVDKDNKVLFAVGHGFDRLQKFDLSDLKKPPSESEVSVGGPQGFNYSSSTDEIYLLNTETKRLLVLDASTLKLKRTLEAGMVSPGDPWIASDDRTNTILIVSEADELDSSPLVLIDRATGDVLDARNEDAGNLTTDPASPLAYLSFFRRRSRVSIYDIQKREIVRTAPIGPHAERMALWKENNELLVTLPPQSSIARVDANSLEVKGNIKTEFGVRAIAVDLDDNLLFTGSIATGRVEIIDLKTLESRRKIYLGPWLRTIEVVPKKGVAYVSSNGAIYEVKYK